MSRLWFLHASTSVIVFFSFVILWSSLTFFHLCFFSLFYPLFLFLSGFSSFFTFSLSLHFFLPPAFSCQRNISTTMCHLFYKRGVNEASGVITSIFLLPVFCTLTTSVSRRHQEARCRSFSTFARSTVKSFVSHSM